MEKPYGQWVAYAERMWGKILIVLALPVFAAACGAGSEESSDEPQVTAKVKIGSHNAETPFSPVVQWLRAAPSKPVNPYDHLRAEGAALRVLKAARSQLGAEYIYGAGPRDPDGLAGIGTERTAPGGFDCSSFVAYAFQAGINQWVSGTIAHTDQIWTQGGELPLDMSPGSTSTIIRGTGKRPPRGGYQPGDILLTRWGAGGFWGHVVMVSEKGRVIQAYPPDVYETDSITKFLAEGNRLGWVRVRSLR